MKAGTMFMFCICFVLLPNHILTIDEKKDLKEIMDAAQDFNEHYNIKSWMLHYDTISSPYNFKDLIGNDQNTTFIGYGDVFSEKSVLWSHQRTMHIFIAKELRVLPKLLERQLNAAKIVKSTSQRHYFGHDMWLVFVSNNDEISLNSIKNVLRNSTIRLDSGIFCFNKNERGFDIHDIYKIDELSDVVMSVKYGEWNKNAGLIVHQPNIWKRRANFQGFNINLSSDYWPPSQTEVVDGCRSPDCFKGTYPSVFHALQEIMNFTYTVRRNPVAGSQLPNGTWIGQIGMVVNGDVKFALDSFGMTNERLAVADYVIFGVGGKGRMYIRNPKDGYDWYAYTKSFTMDAWIGFYLFIFCLPFILWIIMFDWNHPDDMKWGLMDGYALVYKCVLMLGSNIRTDTVSKKIGYLSVLIAGVLLYWLWEAQLISYFSFPMKTLPFHNLEQFLEKSDKKMIILKGSMHQDLFQYSDDPVMQRVWKERIEPNLDQKQYTQWGCQVMKSIVDDDSYVGYIQGSSGDGCMRDCDLYRDCKVVVIPYTIYKSAGSGWIFPKNSPLLPIFSHYVTSLMKEGGMYTRISNKVGIETGSNPLEQCQGCSDIEGEPIGIEKAFSLFGLMIAGGGLSLITFFIEVVFGSAGGMSGHNMNVNNCWDSINRAILHIFFGQMRQ